MAHLMTKARRVRSDEDTPKEGSFELDAARLSAQALLRAAARQAIIAAAADAIAGLQGGGLDAFDLQAVPVRHRGGRPGGPGGEDNPDHGDPNKTNP
jgi:hypothetical protein